MSFTNKILNLLGLDKTEKLPYWLQITTKVPRCTYYFGPFDSHLEAKTLQAGYIEDLISEDAQGIHIELVQCLQPQELTVCEGEMF